MNSTKLLCRNLSTKETKIASQIKHVVLLSFLFLIFSITGFSQNVGISATGAAIDNSAGLDVNFTNKGLLIPRVSLTSTTDVATITTPATSLLVYNINASMTGGSMGYWYWDGAMWVKLAEGTAATGWSLLGNAGTSSATNFLGTTDDMGLSFRTNNSEAMHIDSLQNVSIGVENTTNKFEVAGTFRLHQDSFNMLHTTDLFGPSGAIPGVRFAGTNYKIAGADDLYINGIVDLPPGVSDQPVLSIFGSINTSNPGLQTLMTASPGGINISSQGNTGGSNINLDNLARMNLSIGTVDTNSNIDLNTGGINLNYNINNVGNSNMNYNNTGISLNHNTNNVGYTNMNFQDSVIYQNVNENVTNYRNTGTNIQPDNFNIYNNNNDPAVNTSGGYNFRSAGYSYYLNDNIQNINSSQSLNTGQYQVNINNNAANTNSGYNLNNQGYSYSLNDNVQGIGSNQSLNTGQFQVYMFDNPNNIYTTFNMNNSSASFSGNQPFNFGIGTNTPSNALHVNASVDPVRFEGLQSGSSSDNLVTVDGSGVLHTSAAGSFLGWGLNGNAGTSDPANFIGTTDAQDFVIRTNNVERLRVNSSGTISSTGDLGIGTTAPVSKLDVNAGTISISGIGQGPDQALDFRDLSNGGQGEINWTKSLTHALSASIRSVGNASFSNKGLGFFTNNAPDGTTDAVERMRITPNGHVGIGTSTPKSLLETAGSFGTAITLTTTSLTLDDTYHTIIITGGTPTITLPTAATNNNRRTYRIINQNLLPVTVSSYIDFTGLASVTVLGQSKIEVQSDGTNWYRVD